VKAWRHRGDVPEDSLPARVATFAAAAVAIVAMVAMTGMVFTPLATLAATAAGHRVSWRGRHRARTRAGQAIFAVLLAGAVVYLVLDLTAAVFGGALPQAKFALIALAITSFDLKSRRNLYSHVWHSLVLLYVAALFAWDWTFLAFAAGWAVALFTFLGATRGGLSSLRRATTRLTARSAAPWAAAWLGLGLVVFVALPRFSGRPLSVPLLISLPTSAQTQGETLQSVLPLVGSSSPNNPEQGINLRVRGALGDEVVMRVRAPALSYWRQYVLDQYEGQAWRRTGHAAIEISPVSTNLRLDNEPAAGVSTLPQTFYIERPISVDVPVSYPVRELYFPARSLTLVDTGTVRAPYALGPGVNYAAVSVVRDTSPQRLRASSPPAIDTPELRNYVALPSTVPSRVKRLAASLAAGQPTEYDQTAAIADYLRTHYRYSLDTPRLPAGADAVDEFLFVDHVGFCEQFASALTVMLREVGIPSRLVVGYGSGDHDTFTGTFTVHARDAHAWVEVLFPNTGWVPFDASPGFSGEPVAQLPAHWFLSDFSPSVALRTLGSLGPGATVAAPLLALALLAAAVVAIAMRVRRRQPVPELRVYARAERWLKRGRLPVRAAAATPAEHLGALRGVDVAAAAALAPIVNAVEARVYASRPVAPASAWPVIRVAISRRLRGHA